MAIWGIERRYDLSRTGEGVRVLSYGIGLSVGMDANTNQTRRQRLGCAKFAALLHGVVLPYKPKIPAALMPFVSW
jgi:hypothetical protein